MKITIPTEVDVNLNPTQTILFLKKYILDIIKLHKCEHINDWNALLVIRHGKIFCRYQPQGCEYQYEEIKIENPVVFNLCKAGLETINCFEEIANKQKYSYINGLNKEV